ncbi:MAG: hypothetical protein QM768_16380 [Agriterribacter sp.]
MTICQTLWTSKKDLLENSFGWLTPQHHLMGWALSALKLAQHYKTIHLYTDNSGKEILIDQLGLPYSSVFNDYSNLDYPSYLWALPKLLTYAKQTQPFLHVDGDVMVWEPFDEDLLSAELIAQNVEKGTEYYRNLFTPLCSEIKYLPPVLKQNLASNTKAYNAGIIGGSDLSFFKHFVSLASHFIEKNRGCNLNQTFNVIFEQLLFFALANKERKKVTCLKDGIFDDNGYKLIEFADFPNAKNLKYLHLIGWYKRSKVHCDWLARYLRQENEEVFLRIIRLFQTQHYFYNNKLREIYPVTEPLKLHKFIYEKTLSFVKSLNADILFNSNARLGKYVENCQNSLLKELFKYEKSLSRICTKFSKIDFTHLKKLEEDSLTSLHFFSSEKEKRMQASIYRNPYTEIMYSAFDWTSLQISEMNNLNIRCSDKKNIVIAIIPELFFSGYREVVLDQLCVNIIVLTEKRIPFKNLLEQVRGLFPLGEDPRVDKELWDSITSKVAFLIENKILFICN